MEGFQKFDARMLRTSPFRVCGGVATEDSAHGFFVRRLPDWTRHLLTSEMDRVVQMPVGVNITFETDADTIAVEAKLGLVYTPPRKPPTTAFDLEIDGQVHTVAHNDGDHWLLDAKDPSRHQVREGLPYQATFTGLGNDRKHCTLWLPHNVIVEVRALYLSPGTRVWPAAIDQRPRWLHYGSSISHCIEANRPTGTWPVVAARQAGCQLECMGFAGQCHLDPFVARAMAEQPADFISMKIGINIVVGDSFSKRTFTPAVHGFLDTLRDAHPDTPMLLISPIYRLPVPEVPMVTMRRLRRFVRARDTFPRVNSLLTLEYVRQALADLVSLRRERGDANLHYLDGLELFGADDAAEMPDGVHPSAQGYRTMGARFAEVLATQAHAP